MKFSIPNVETMISQMIMVGLKGSDKKSISIFLDSLPKYGIGGVILYDEDISSSKVTERNIINSSQLKSFTSNLQSHFNIPLLIGIDQEGGNVNRLKKIKKYNNIKSWHEIGKYNDINRTKTFAQNTAKALSEHGININFAPVLDLSINATSIIAKKGRCFSRNPKQLAEHSKIFIEEHLSNKILAIGKHFPGQGSAIADTHYSMTDSTNEWSINELLPYELLIKEKCLHGIMTSHIYNLNLDSKYPATLSSKILNELLRQKMNFSGIIISDDPQMKAISDHYELKESLSLMINAGIDIFCFGNNLIYNPDIAMTTYRSIKELLDKNKIKYESILRSYQRIMKVKSLLKLI